MFIYSVNQRWYVHGQKIDILKVPNNDYLLMEIIQKVKGNKKGVSSKSSVAYIGSNFGLKPTLSFKTFNT